MGYGKLYVFYLDGNVNEYERYTEKCAKKRKLG